MRRLGLLDRGLDDRGRATRSWSDHAPATRSRRRSASARRASGRCRSRGRAARGRSGTAPGTRAISDLPTPPFSPPMKWMFVIRLVLFQAQGVAPARHGASISLPPPCAGDLRRVVLTTALPTETAACSRATPTTAPAAPAIVTTAQSGSSATRATQQDDGRCVQQVPAATTDYRRFGHSGKPHRSCAMSTIIRARRTASWSP